MSKVKGTLGDPDHDHTDHYEGIGQSVFMGQNGATILIVTSVMCKYCGIIFTNAAQMQGPGGAGGVATAPRGVATN